MHLFTSRTQLFSLLNHIESAVRWPHFLPLAQLSSAQPFTCSAGKPSEGERWGKQAGRLQWSLSAELKGETGVAKRALLLKRAFVSLRKGRSFHFHFPQTTDLSDSVKASPMSAALTNRKASCQSYLLQEKRGQT